MEPCLLVASPQMKDPFFEGTLILLCHHNENGAIGLVINRETSLTIETVLQQLSLELGREFEQNVNWGGPVEPGAGFVVYAGDISSDEGWNLTGGLVVSPSRDRLSEALLRGHSFLLCLGYAGWGPGQLDGEVQSGSWVITDIDPAIVLSASMEDRYDLALAQMGLNAQTIWMKPVDE